jgi:hypothetical protein
VVDTDRWTFYWGSLTENDRFGFFLMLAKRREGFRNSEVHEVAKAIPLWPTHYEIPRLKTLRGVGDDVCGRLLCPPSHDWNDPS